LTLLEVLVAIALSTVLISAVYGAVHLQWKLRSASERDIHRARKFHGIVQDLTYDLRACRLLKCQPDPVEEQTGKREGTQDADRVFTGPGIRERILQLEPGLGNDEQIAFIGRSDSLLLSMASENRRFPAIRQQAGLMPQVIWFVNSGHGVQVPSVRGNGEPEHHPAAAADSAAGLNRLTFSGHENQSGRSSCTLIDPEVHAMQLRYFDGSVWHLKWNSSQSGTLPLAVEVTLLRKQRTARSGASGNWTATASRKMVIHMPLAAGGL